MHLFSSRSALLATLALSSLAGACATIGKRSTESEPAVAANTAPEWLSHEVGCSRAQLDYHWNHERNGSTTDTDSACVVLGRWGQPSYSNISHFFADSRVGDTELTQVQLSWRSTIPDSDVNIRAYKKTLGERPDSGYFRIDRTVNPVVKPDTSHTGVIAGIVLDTLGFQLHRPVQVCAERYLADERTMERLGCTTTAAGGAFRIDSLPIASMGVHVICQTVRLLGQQPNQASEIVSAGRKPGTVVILMNTTGCDTRPERSVSRTFRGVWRSGFEMSNFSPCPKDSWAIASDTIGIAGHGDVNDAWVTSLPPQGGPRWPRHTGATPLARSGGYASYVEWHATVTGPGHYGHLGGSSFKMVVDSVTTMRAPSPRDCR